MERAGDLQGVGDLLFVRVVKVRAIGDEAADLPAGLRVLVDEARVEAELGGGDQRKRLGLSVDDLVGAGARVAVDVALALAAEQHAEVREAGVERAHLGDVLAAALQRAADVVEDGRVDVLHEVGVEGAEVAQVVELVDRVLVEHLPREHVQLVDVLDEDGLPQLALSLGQVVLVVEDVEVVLGEGLVQVGGTLHAPGVVAVPAGGDDEVVGAELEGLLGAFAACPHGGAVRAVFIAAEEVLLVVLVGRANVGVAEVVASAPERGVVVPRHVLGRLHELHAELLLEVVEALLHGADDDVDVVDAGLLELTDEPLDENLSADAEERLGALEGKRCEATAKAGGQDDGALHAVGGKLLKPLLSNRGTFVQQAFLAQLLERLVG